MAFALAASVFAVISIHALREESDLSFFGALAPYKKFQSTLSVRRATRVSMTPMHQLIFQSTLSVRRATWDEPTCCPSATNFNPRSP